MNLSKFFKAHYSWLVPIVVALGARLYGITHSSIWHDEGYTMWLVNYDWGEIITRTARDVHPPGYYLLTKIWVSVFSSSVFSVRLFSVIFSIGIVYFLYRIIERLFNREAAFFSALFLALSPFMIRFAQEARMYGVVAFFTTLASYYLVLFLKERQGRHLIVYCVAMIIAVYTQYYAFFVIIAHWLIVAICTPGFFSLKWAKSLKQKVGFFNPSWWISTIILILAYLPWFPIAYRQVTRVSGSYWILPEWITARTIPNSILQFTVFGHLDSLSSDVWGRGVYWLAAAVLIGSGFSLLLFKGIRKKVLGLLLYGYLPMVLVFTLSKLRTPIYQDRYFPFSAVAIFALWGILVSKIRNIFGKIVAAGLMILILLVGNYYMHHYTNHQMKQLHQAVAEKMQPGDLAVSGELYTFLDGIYYFGDGNLRLLSDGVDGYGESSLFYDQQEKYLINENEIGRTTSRVFVIGKSGDKDYFSDSHWMDYEPEIIFEKDGLKAVLYHPEAVGL